MAESKVSVSDGVLTLTASPVGGEPPAKNGGVQYPIHYLSGTIHANQTFTVQPDGGYDISADFKAPLAKGTWPAFWLTAVKGWPPEIDLAEWKGSGKVSFNTFNTSSEVASENIDYPNDDQVRETGFRSPLLFLLTAASLLVVAHRPDTDSPLLGHRRIGQVLHGRARNPHAVW